MVSAIDPTKPLDGVPAVKSDLRDNLQAAKAEIEALQNKSILGQTGDVTITALPQQPSPANTAKVAVEQTDGSFRSVALSDLPVVSSGSSNGTTNVKSAPFNATGDGTTNDTAAIQAAIDATANNGVVYLPPGNYSVNRLNVPHNRAIKFQGASPWATTLIGRTSGQDIFRITDPGGAAVQDRFVKVHVYENLGFRLNTGTGSPNLTTGFNRCTTAGLAVGPCCIAYTTSFVPTATGDPGINAAWLHSFGVVRNCVVNVSTKHANHGCGFIHHGANHYGWTYENIWIEGAHYGITDSLPWSRRVTVSSSTDRLTVANGTNPFQNGQTLFVAAHTATGAMPGGLNRFQVYHVVNRNSTSFQLSTTSGGAAIDITSNGSGGIYVYGASSFAGEYAPDGITIDRLTHYAGRCPISLTNTENLHIGRVDSYGAVAALHLYAVESLTRKENIGPVVDAFYSESPQSTTMPVGEDIVHVNAVSGAIGYLQVRGESGNVTSPPVRFKGRGYRVNGLDLISSFSQAQPAIILDGSNIGLFGRVHTACTLTDNGSDNYYLLTQDSGGWKFRSNSPFL
ncbi:MAG: glycosyl hydrolase family 28-related protein [Alphaproteobacteria bacterium]